MKIIIIGGRKTYGRHGNALRLAVAEAAYRHQENTILQKALQTEPTAATNMPAYSAWHGWN